MVWSGVAAGLGEWRCKQKENTAMSSIDRFNEIAGHLSEIAETENYENRAAKERSRPLSSLAARDCAEFCA